jgi:putative Mg2+ transporter-C (MgtC) family protein
MLDWTDIVSRLGAAMAIGGALGLNRELHNKPTGLRTLGLVGLGSALAVLAVADDP